MAIKTVIFGLGISGISAAKLALSRGEEVILVNEGDPKSWRLPSIFDHLKKVRQSDAADIFAKCDQIIISPGIDPYLSVLEPARRKEIPIISEIEYAYSGCRAPIVAITGTNGKTTCVTLLAYILRSLGLNVFVGGNIGTPFCDYHLNSENYDFCILELSSFQLQSIFNFHPQVAIILNISTNHQERHATLGDYQNAKLNIFKNSKDADLKLTHVSLKNLSSLYLEAAQFYSEQEVADFDWSQCPLVGSHRLSNFAAVKRVCDFYSLKVDWQHIINNFPGVEHRIEYIGKFNIHNKVVSIYNDAKSTNFAATLSALSSFNPAEVTLIFGGQLRSADFDCNIEQRELLSQCAQILLIGESTKLLERELQLNNIKTCFTLELAFERFLSNPSQILLLSPAFPSFDQFKSYADRGFKFKQLVRDHFGF